MEFFGVVLDVALDLRTAREKVHVMVVRVRKAREFVELFRYLKTKIGIVFSPHASHIFSLFKDAALEALLVKEPCSLQACDTCAHDGNALHLGDIGLRRHLIFEDVVAHDEDSNGKRHGRSS